MEHPILNAIQRASFTPLGWFAPRADDRVPHDARFVILIGNAGPEMFRRFARERDPHREKLDDWCRESIGALARDLDARAIFPFDKPPYPFLTWARRGGAGHVSPLGLIVHPQYGLWHAYRAALLFPVAFDLGAPAERIRAAGVGHVFPLTTDAAVVNGELLSLTDRLTEPLPESREAPAAYPKLLSDYYGLFWGRTQAA